MKKPTKTQLDTFYLTFVGEFVEAFGRFTTTEGETSMKASGYLLDIDDEFYYLGPSADEITTAIRKTSVDLIQSAEEKNMVRELLDSIPVPQNEEGHN